MYKLKKKTKKMIKAAFGIPSNLVTAESHGDKLWFLSNHAKDLGAISEYPIMYFYVALFSL